MTALLLLLLDSRAPAGAHSHSGGMEAAVMTGQVTGLAEVEEFCRGRLRTSGRVAASFAAAACLAWRRGAGAGEWAALDAEFGARTPSEASRAASRQLGSGLRRLLRSMCGDADLATPWAGCPPPAPHHPLVLGAGIALAAGAPELAARAAALATCTSPASAAVRLLGLDPFAVQAMLARLAPEIDALAAECHAVAGAADAVGGVGAASAVGTVGAGREFPGLPANGAPALELLADFHLTAEVRLFAS